MNVSQGDLAYIVNAEVPEAIGCVCKVVKSVGEVHFKKFGYVYTWLISLSDPCKTVGGTVATEVIIPDLALRRICGPSGSVDTDEQVVDQSPVEQLVPELA